MLTSQPILPLRRTLWLDAIVSGATGLLLLFGATFLVDLFALPEALLRYAGLALVPYVAFVVFVAQRQPVSLTATWVVIVANVLWATASIALLFTGWVAPNVLGGGFVLFQALVVAAFAVLQFMALRHSPAVASKG